MISRSVIIFFLAFVVFVNAAPLRHGRRSTCHPRSLSVSSTATANATSTAKTTHTSSVATSSSAAASTVPTTVQSLAAAGALTLNALFPVSGASSSWTTSPKDSSALALSDATLRPTKVDSSLTHSYVNAPDGKLSMQAHYPEGSYTFGHEPAGGISFYAPGPSDVDLTTAKEATFGYSVYFEEGFEFNLGGKLPGLYGGNSQEEAYTCSGGRRDGGCFSARLMWRTDGAGELYTYLPPYTDSEFAANEVQCSVPPFSTCNPTYGASVGRGSFSFKAGGWTTVTERVRLNDVGQANGELELFVNGESVINVSGLILVDSSEGRMYGIQMQTFFGGSTSNYASPKTQDAYFSDFTVAITEKL
ncbi:hypothetical protein H0H92_014343 [Tricholoma furcatifolium]|nr:hypothetical protein H0H92_014343 [Tricholoma furcatifolium]